LKHTKKRKRERETSLDYTVLTNNDFCTTMLHFWVVFANRIVLWKKKKIAESLFFVITKI
jgi:ATP-dependent Clp protease adapter protein ClpS